MELPSLEKYWGVILKSVQFDHASMSLVMNVFWTSDGAPHHASLHFRGVSRLNFSAEKVYPSERVELISIEANSREGSVEIEGELSNYCFSISCDRVAEALE